MRMQSARDAEKRLLGLLIALALVLCAVSAGGCIFWKPTLIIAHPDAATLVTDVRRRYYRTAVYDNKANKLIDVGWTRFTRENLVGCTISKFDWEAHMAKRGSDARDSE
jgi:hypothetical protein